MKKSIKKVLGTALALIMVCTMIPAFASVAYGETNPGYGAVKVPYERKGNHDYQVQDPDWVHVYCIHPTKGGESNGANMNFRWKIDLLANKWMFDNSQRDVNGSNKPGSGDLNKLVSILWHGDKTNAHFMDIQNAVWWFVTNGTADYKTNTSSYKNSIVTAAGDSGWALPSSYQLYLYVPDREAASTTLQNAVRLVYSDVPETWEVGTTANVEGKGSSSKDAPLEFAIEEGKTKTAPLTVSDTIKYTGAMAGMTFTIQTKLMKLNEDGTSTLIKDRGEQSPFTAEGEEGTWSGEMLTFWNVELEAGTYYFDEIVKNNASGKTVTHSGKGDNAQTFIVKSAGEQPPIEEKNGELSTTVEVNGSKGSESAEAKIKVPAGEKSIVTDVKDTIDYKNLVKGNTYKVQGTLMEVAEDGSVSEVAKSDAEDKVAEDVNGTWEITFKNVTLEVGKKYVVFESATPIKDAENNEITDGKVIEHNDPKDKAQTVVVEEEEPKEEEPNIPEPEGEKIDIPVQKVWDEEYIGKEKRPTSITVHLYANGEPVGEPLVMSEETGWKGLFEKLDKTDSDGKEIEYTITEDYVDYYYYDTEWLDKTYVVTNHRRPWIPNLPFTPGNVGEVKVQKTVSGAAEKDQAYNITVAFTYKDGSTYTHELFMKPSDEAFVFDYVPAGTKVSISEKTTGYDMTCKVDGKDATNFTVEIGKTHSVIVNNDKPTKDVTTGDRNNMIGWLVLLTLTAALSLTVAARRRIN